jgi:adenine deaminase
MRRHWVAVARGDEEPDLVLKGGRILSVFTAEIFTADVAIVDGYIVGVGSYDGSNEVDVTDRVLIPGYIDGHCHVESSKLTVDEFARAILPMGTTSVVVDPHELANVLGTRGVEYMLASSKGLPLGVYVMMPSCVPASPFESAAFPLEACDFAELLARPRVIGIAEMMNYPAAIAGQPELMSKMAMTQYMRIDGHAPGVSGRELNAYIVSGPNSDHECTTLEEALEKKRLGMWIMIREASMIRNLVDLLPLVQNYGDDHCMFVTDDREAGTLLEEGHVNSMVRTAVEHGLPVATAVRLATINVARWHRLESMGAIAPGYRADIQVLPDLERFMPDVVLKDGTVVARDGRCLLFDSPPVPTFVRNTVHARPLSTSSFKVAAAGGSEVRVIELIPDQVVTKASTGAPRVVDDDFVADPDTDLAKVAVIERHHATGRVGVGFVRGFGLQSGAFASTIAHDAHNLVVIGVNDQDMVRCVERLQTLGGGLVAVKDGEVLGELALEVAGLMSVQPAAQVAAALHRLEHVLRTMGVSLPTPYMYLGFLALSVIPELRLTDRGLVDVRSFQLVPLSVQ